MKTADKRSTAGKQQKTKSDEKKEVKWQKAHRVIDVEQISDGESQTRFSKRFAIARIAFRCLFSHAFLMRNWFWRTFSDNFVANQKLTRTRTHSKNELSAQRRIGELNTVLLHFVC